MPTLTKEAVETIRSLLDDDGIDYSIRTDYSGRGMHGKTCFAIVTPCSSWIIALALFVKNPKIDPDVRENLEDCLEQAPEEDSMGRSSKVYYWRSVSIEKEDEETTEEEPEVSNQNIQA